MAALEQGESKIECPVLADFRLYRPISRRLDSAPNNSGNMTRCELSRSPISSILDG
jgi:hypothetical protein